MKQIGIDFVEGRYIAKTDYNDKGKRFPLAIVHVLRDIDNILIKLLIDRARWKEQGGDRLQPQEKVFLSYGIYSVMNKGKEIILHIFEDLLEVT